MFSDVDELFVWTWSSQKSFLFVSRMTMLEELQTKDDGELELKNSS
jgi:hypothetical protein